MILPLVAVGAQDIVSSTLAYGSCFFTRWNDNVVAADRLRLRTVFGAYRAGLAEQRREVERAAGLIGAAVLEWACRPGGACARVAQRSFLTTLADG